MKLVGWSDAAVVAINFKVPLVIGFASTCGDGGHKAIPYIAELFVRADMRSFKVFPSGQINDMEIGVGVDVLFGNLNTCI